MEPLGKTRALTRGARLGLVVLLAVGSALARGWRGADPPGVVLWAWDRPEDLRFADPRRAAVASLVGTLRLRADRVQVEARPHPLIVAAGTVLVPVVRIETDPLLRPVLSGEQRRQAAAAIAALVGGPTARHVQLDFDATRRERSFYRALLSDLRVRLAPDATLSITALASWCFGDRWLDDLPVDFAVPMLFRMGPDGEAIRLALDGGLDFPSPLCRHGAGVSLDEPIPLLPPGRPLYVFAPRPWSAVSYRDAVALAGGSPG